MKQSADTLIDIVARRAELQPDDCAYVFLSDSDQEERITYAELDARARAVAQLLQLHPVEGERVLLLYPPGLEYLTAFFGCLYAGAIAVPAYPPRRNGLTRGFPRLRSIINDAQPRIALTTDSIRPALLEGFADDEDVGTLRILTTDTLSSDGQTMIRRASPGPESVAFLQYTSGSTAAPRGVKLTHRNLLHNLEALAIRFGHTRETRGVIWLPPYHDMGLIGGVLQPLYSGYTMALLSPASFLQSPVRWLQAITRFGATTSGGPNFAYDLCTRRVTDEQKKGLDLSTWEIAFNGAEPVQAGTLDRFAGAFEDCGFRRHALYPCYGLAEATLFVSGGRKGAAPILRGGDTAIVDPTIAAAASDTVRGRELVGCGESLEDQQITIVDPEQHTPLPGGHVGEIWVSGPSVADGYWGRAQETCDVFHARLAGGGDRRFLRTGDLGLLEDGQLFVCGRLKDLIIIRGRNHYPHDIETTVGLCHPALHGGGAAAFSIAGPNGEEQLVVVHEVARHHRGVDPGDVASCARRAVSEIHEVQLHTLVLTTPGRVPRTSSGKIQRYLCRHSFLAGDLDALAVCALEAAAVDAFVPTPDRGDLLAAEPDEAIRLLCRYLTARIADVRGCAVHDLDPQRPLAEAGLDSLMVLELQHSIESDLAVLLPMADFLHGQTVQQIAGRLHDLMGSRANDASGRAIAAAESEYPLSHGQQALWVLHQLAPQSSAYNIASAIRIVSDLDIPALHRALDRLVDRHPLLRTTIGLQGEQPVQQTHDAGRSVLTFENVEALTEYEVEDVCALEVDRPFDLEQGPLFRATIYRRAEREHLLLVSVHHLVADQWSMAVLMRELGLLYAAELNGMSVELPEPGCSYRTFVAWQREMLAGVEGERHWEYWRDQLSSVPFVLDFPTTFPRPAVQTYNGASHAVRIDSQLSSALKELAHSLDATLFVVMQAAFQVLLHRYSGQDQFLIGVPTTGRVRAGFADVVGYFVNPVLLRADLRDDPTFSTVVRRVRRTVADALQHQAYPFPQLVERLNAGRRDASRSPLFQVMFVLDQPLRAGDIASVPITYGIDGNTVDFGQLRVQPLAITPTASQFDITCRVADAGDEMGVSITYNTDLFDERFITNLAAHFQTLLAAVAGDVEQRVSGIDMIGSADRERLLLDWSGAGDARAFLADERFRSWSSFRVHELFEQRVREDGGRTAVLFHDEELSYEQVNEEAERLARSLCSLGVGPEITVGICLERTPIIISAMLAVMKAGGAYVPLDPQYPFERLRLMLEDAAPAVIITQDELVERLPASSASILRVGPLLDPDVGDATQRPLPGGTPENLAYIIYTSGTTGRPKGIAIEHRSVVALAAWATSVYTAAELEGVLASTSLSFDLSVFEILITLCLGGTVVLVENVLALPTIRSADRVTLINSVPSLVAELMRNGGLPRSVRTVNLAGEPLQRWLVDAIYSRSKTCRVINLYGPGEDTTYSTIDIIPRDDNRAPTIGRPLPGTRVYIVDDRLRPVPQGVPGELLIGGLGLARGYTGNAALTAERFITDPFTHDGEARLYRTGDRARWRPDGSIEFLGRLDHQVKLRGIRIELGEIEAALRSHSAVRDALALVREDVPGEPYLAAYVVTNEGAHFTPASLREDLQRTLPAYMLPSALIALPSLPLNANGKVDIRALPLPVRPEGTGRAQAPRTPVEETLLGIWRDVLGVATLDVHDNFFELGGHSLLASRIAVRVRNSFGVQLPLRALFESPTVGALASRISRERWGGEVAPIEPAPRSGHPPLSFAQQRLWFLDQLQGASAAYNVSVALHLHGRLDVAALEESLNAIIRRHEALRTTFELEEGTPVQVVHPVRRLLLPLVNLDVQQPGDRDRLAAQFTNEIARRPFDMSQGPMVRVCLLRLEENEHLLLLATHHIVFDGSVEHFFRELSAHYNAVVTGTPAGLPDPRVQYADVVSWQRRWLAGAQLDRQLAYWRETLGGELPLLQLPADRPRPHVMTSHGARVRLALPGDLVDALNAVGAREGATLFMTMLAAFKVLLARYAGQDDIIVGSPIDSRSHLETEGLIGCFVNTLALRTDLSGEPTFRELLARVREVTLDAYAHQDVPFEKLVEHLQPPRDVSRTPIFQVMFTLQRDPAALLDMKGLSTAVDTVDTGTSRFDMLVGLLETAQGVSGSIEYNTDLFDAATIERLIGHYTRLLECVAADPMQRITEIELLSDRERRQILVDWNTHAAPATAGRDASDICIHTLFEERARMQGDHIAIVSDDRETSYAELDAAANRLAHYLHQRGIVPGEAVAVYMKRSSTAIAALLGILKAGAAYVPLEPAYPGERIATILSSLQVRILITDHELHHHLQQMSPDAMGVGHILVLDTDKTAGGTESGSVWDEAWMNVPSTTPELPITADAVAYTIFTSGSTGVPKGVVVGHRAVVNLIRWVNRTFELNHTDRGLFVTSFCFDLSVYDIFGMLAAGGSVRIVSDEGLRDPERIMEILCNESITFWDSAPAALQQLVPFFETTRGVAERLRLVFLSGDWIPVTLPDLLRHRFPDAEVVSLGGATEATVWSNYYRIGLVDPAWASIPYGRPIPGARYHVLDAGLRPVPIGVAGDLYIGGECLALGYANDPDLTSQKFIPDPFGRTPGDRLYRTGDRARYWNDGTIEFLGRLDHQVKVRGFRIELGEIESALVAHADIREAVVVAQGQSAMDRHLAAYIVPVSGRSPQVREVREFLERTLPEYMIPAAFMSLNALPLTASGKIDRRALPTFDVTRQESIAPFVAPRAEIECTIAGIWREKLGVERVGLHDNFFDLGGHSLHMVEILTQLRSTLQRRLTIVDLFQHPTIHSLAEFLGAPANGRQELDRGAAIDQGKKRMQRALQQRRYSRE